jgi:ELWxxDGT repeat protein
MHRSQQHSRFFIRRLVALLTLIFSVTLLVPSPDPVAYANEPLLLKTFSQFSRATVFRGMFFFAANDGVHGFGLWRSDGTPDGTQLVRVIRHGPGSNEILGFRVVGDTLFFVADDGVHGFELWRSDGTPDGTTLVRDIRVGSQGSFHAGVYGDVQLIGVGNTLFFIADDGVHGFELWRSDGTPDGTMLVRDIHPGSGSALTGNETLAVMNDTLYFIANSGEVTGTGGLWRSDGTYEGTFLLRHVRADQWSALLVNNSTLFVATSDSLWKSDGTPEGTVLVKDRLCIDTGLTHFAFMNGVLFFVGSERRDGWFMGCETELMRSDGTLEGTFMVKDIHSSESGFPAGGLGYFSHLTVVSNTLFFNADDGVHGRELWKSDGTEAGTVMVKDIDEGSGHALYPTPFVVLNGMIFFIAEDGVHGRELWRSDGTAAGTVMVKDIITNDLWRSNLSSLSIGASLTALHTMLFFNVDDDFAHRDKFGFWRSDGTEEGTVQLLSEWAYARAVICGQVFITSQTNLYTLLIDPNRCTVSGRVTDGAGNGVAGVTVSAGERSATTDATGFYTISGLPTGVYTLTATRSGYQITPASRTVTVNDHLSGQDFTATLLTYTISGRVTDGAGNGVAGVTVSAGERSATTDASGFYALSGLPTGVYTLTATRSGYQITPASRTVTVSDHLSGQDFTATLLTYTIGGRVTDGAGNGVAGVTVSAGERSATTDATGFYTISGLPTGVYTLTATRSGYQITPASRTVTVNDHLSGQDFTATLLTYTISGRVTDGAGNGVAGVTVSAGERSATTDANGFYALSGLSSGVYALRAEKPGCLIEPAQRAVTLPPDHDAQDFTAICITERAFLPLVIR